MHDDLVSNPPPPHHGHPKKSRWGKKTTPHNIQHILYLFAKREEVEHFAHLASYDEMSGNDYNLSVSTYVEAEDTREKIDIVKLNAEIKEIVAREQMLRDEIDKIIAEIEV